MNPVSHSRTGDLYPSEEVLLARLRALILAHNPARNEKSIEGSKTNLRVTEPHDNRSGIISKGKEREGDSNLPDISRLFPAPPGPAPHWKSHIRTHGSTSDLTDHGIDAEDEYVIVDGI